MQRRKLHAASAAVLEQEHRAPGALQRAAAVLAHHLEQAEEFERATDFYDMAGAYAHSVHANEEARRLLERARSLSTGLEHAPSALVGARRERLLGLSALAMGDINGALSHLTEAVGVAGRPWPRSKASSVSRSLVGFVREMGKRWTARAEPPLLPGEERELLLEAARGYERLLVVHYFATGDMLAVVLAAFTNVGLAERAGGASAERALGYATLAAMFALARLDSRAQSYGTRALETGRDSGDEVALTWVKMNVALVHLQAGRWLEMRGLLEEVRDSSARMGFARRWEEATSQFSTGLLLNGRLEESKSLNDELLGRIERADPQSRCWAEVREAELRLLQDEFSGALTAARAGANVCRQGLGRAEWIFALGTLAIAELRSGNRPAARAAADQCLDWIRRGNAPVFYHVFPYAALAETYLSLHAAATDRSERAELVRCVRRTMAAFRAIASAIAVAAPRERLFQGFAALRLDGSRRRARGFFAAALEAARRRDMPYDEALALTALSEAEPTSAARRAHLEQAAALFARIGATSDRSRVQALLAGDAAS